jgi:hypothetical protein
MALSERVPRPEIIRAYLNTLQTLGDPNQGEPLISVNLPVFVLSLGNLASGLVAEGARETGWQCFSFGPGGVTSGDVAGLPSGQPAASRSRGPSVEKAYSAYEQLKRLDIDLVRSVNVDYEPRALRIPGIHIEALWLRKKPFSERIDHDYVVPFHTLDQNLAAKLLFTMPEFLDIARPLARKQLAVIPPRD